MVIGSIGAYHEEGGLVESSRAYHEEGNWLDRCPSRRWWFVLVESCLSRRCQLRRSVPITKMSVWSSRAVPITNMAIGSVDAYQEDGNWLDRCLSRRWRSIYFFINFFYFYFIVIPFVGLIVSSLLRRWTLDHTKKNCLVWIDVFRPCWVYHEDGRSVKKI